MTTLALARSYFLKARKRRRALEVLLEDGAYSDVVREAQELVELVFTFRRLNVKTGYP